MTKLNLIILFLIQTMTCSWALGHALLTSPTPRNNNAGIKTGPCGGLARSATPTVVQGGQTLTITWRETINHPGRYIFSLSTANDANFAQNRLATVIDTQDDGNTPHNYSTTVQIPNINCETCTIQMIQSMEENPASPTYYYSCADIRIVATGASPSGPPVVSQSTSLNDNSPKMASCGRVQDINSERDQFSYIILSLFLLLSPIIISMRLRNRHSL